MKTHLKNILFIVSLISCPFFTKAQNRSPQEIKSEILKIEQKKNYKSDTTYLRLINELGFYYAENLPDSAILLLSNHPDLCHKLHYFLGEVDAYKHLGTAYQMKGNYLKAIEYFEIAMIKAKKQDINGAIPAIQSNMGLVFMNQGNYPKALQNFYLALKESENLDNRKVTARIWNNIGIVHFFQGNMEQAIKDYKKMLDIATQLNDHHGIALANNNLGEAYFEQNDLDAALKCFIIANNLVVKDGNINLQIECTKNIAYVFLKKNETIKSIQYFNLALGLAQNSGNQPSVCKALIGLATAYNEQKDFAKALEKSNEAISLASAMRQTQLVSDAYEIRALIYENKGDGLSALNSFKLYKSYSDTLKNVESKKATTLILSDFEFFKKEIAYQKVESRQRWIIFSVIAALISSLIIALIINQNRNRAKMANKILAEKNKNIESQKSILEKTLSQLKTTQAQLIQTEKLASLGELVAGIAHEIQNPLNFVNNFSELSGELVTEMNEAIDKGNNQDVKEISNDLKTNLEKINHHGKRASSIVKGMLEHSRTSTGKKELTDINALSDEYLRLSYQGLRARDKGFIANFKTDFDTEIPKVELIPQDIGRVLLNLINNAFQAVAEEGIRRKQLGDLEYKSMVSIKTELKANNSLLITIKDNGPGIPESIKDKIFQPFFTTKPSGQGTGLGLSLAYDLVTKGHGGKLFVESTFGEGTNFIINLPIS